MFISLFVCELKGQSINSNSILFQQNKIEIVLDVSCDLTQVNQTKIMDTLFLVSQRAVIQLEKNLIYKMSNRIKFIVFDEIKSFQEYQNLENSRTETSVNHPSTFLNIYTPIFIGTGLRQIEYQIKKGASTQFLEEYLYGLSFREKLDGIQHSPVPTWITKGFVEYFSGGIQVNDFHEFIINSKKGYYNNINFIPADVQTNFGSVIWYMFEKEKGRNFNSAFWYLIKFANSFQNSFEYQFGVKFKKWLREKMSEIESKYKLESFKPDFSTGHISRKSFYLFQLLEADVQKENVIYCNFYNSQFQYLYKFLGLQKTLIYKNETDAQSLKSTFNRFEIIHIPENTSQNLKGLIMLHFHEGQWRISEITDVNSTKLIQVLGKTGSYRNFKKTDSGYSMIYEDYGNTALIEFDIQYKKTIIRKFDNLHLFDYLIDKQKNNQYFLNSSNSKNQKFCSYIIKQSPIGLLDTIFIDSSNIGEVKLENLIIESDNHLSFVKSGENQQQVTHLFLINGKWIVKILESKGFSYQQYSTLGSKDIYSIYQSSNSIMMNKFQKDEMIYAQDTFVRKLFSFDTLKPALPIVQNQSNYDSSNGYFVSHFKITQTKAKVNSAQKKPAYPVPLKSGFLNSFYSTQSKLYLSNEEIDLPYRTTIPINSLYNTIGTLYFKHQLLSDNKKHQFLSSAFSTIDRNRYGLTFEHHYQKDKNLSHQVSLKFRSRQFKQEFSDLFENKVARFAYSISTRNPYFNSSIKYAYQIQTDIDLNTSEIATINTNKYHHLHELVLSISPKKAIKKGNWAATGFLDIILSSVKSEDSNRNISRINAMGRITYVGKFIEFKSKLNAHYSLFNDYFLNIVGGSYGSLISSQYNGNILSQIKHKNPIFMEQNGHIRGFPVGARIGSSSLVIQNDVYLSPLNLFPSRVIESNFWKKLFFVGFFDIGTAFNGRSPGDLSNPFNSKMYQANTYTLTVNAERDAYLIGLGYGINFNILGYDFRVERAFGFNENSLQNKLFHFCIGKNF